MCAPAPVLTGHKWQGQTVERLLVGSWGGYKYGRDGWAYVVLSRAQTASGIYLLEPLPTNVKKFKPRKEIKREYQRLRVLVGTTRELIQEAIARDLLPLAQVMSPSTMKTLCVHYGYPFSYHRKETDIFRFPVFILPRPSLRRKGRAVLQ
jgi:hypothetical protein